MSENYLLCSDLQAPAHHPDALKFLKMLAKEYNVHKDNILIMGDELDLERMSLYEEDGNEEYTPTQELKLCRDFIKEMSSIFPKARVCYSNHGLRLIKKAGMAKIPVEMLKSYHDIFEIPQSWKYDFTWKINCKYPFMIEHGHSYGGMNAHRQAAMHNGMSTAIGHCHSFAAIDYIRTKNLTMWCANTGSLIDEKRHAFKYSRDHKLKACIGTTVVLDSGRTPIWIPL